MLDRVFTVMTGTLHDRKCTVGTEAVMLSFFYIFLSIFRDMGETHISRGFTG